MHVRFLAVALAGALMALGPSAASMAEELRPRDYFSVNEYKEANPREIELMERFEEIVRAPGRRMAVDQKRPVRIAFIYPGIQASDYWRRSVASFRKRMDEIGLKFELFEYFTTLTDTRAQEEQIRQALAKDPDYLVFTLYVGGHKRLIERLVARGRPKVIMQNITTPPRSWEGNQPFMYVGFDHAMGAYMLADYFLKKTGGTGDYSVLYFSPGYISVMRGDTFVEYMNQWSKKRLVDGYYTDGNRDKARLATLDILKGPPVGFIYACSTDIALGALDALKEAGRLGEIPVNGWGGGSAELEAVARGELDVTVMRMNDDNGAAMAEAIRLDLEGRGDEVPTIYSGDFALVEKGMDPKRLDGLIARAFRYSGVRKED